MQHIRKMIGDGNLEKALDMLIQEGKSEAYLLKSQYNNAKSIQMLGVLEDSEWRRTYARISYAALEMCTVSGTAQPETQMPPVSLHALDTWLLQTIAANKRRNEALSNEAQALLTRYRDHQDEKAKNPSFDPAGRRLDGILKGIKDFKYSLEEKCKDNLENTVSRINFLISDRVPTYEQLQEAYNLAVGRGMSDKTVERLLEARANDEEPRISIAERIESFLSTIK